MNILFSTQGIGLEIYMNVLRKMRGVKDIDKAGFYVTNSHIYKDLCKSDPEIKKQFVLKEWEILEKSSKIEPNISLLKKYEEKIGQPFLWDLIVGDRRIYLGKNYAFAQDYKPHFSHERMLSIIQVGIEDMERMFDEIKPDLVVSFQCVTLGDHLSCLVAKSRGVQVLNLRPIRIKNYIFAGEDVYEPSQKLQNKYLENKNNGINDESLKDEAKKYILNVKEDNALYEGVVLPSDKPPITRKKQINLNILKDKIKNLLSSLDLEFNRKFGREKYDTSISGYFKPTIFEKFTKPYKANSLRNYMAKRYLRQQDLKNLNYAFFPLHTEPEVTLSVYSKAHLNQIETIRLISHSLPVGMKLVVKEHPWAIGKRNLGFYKKIISIPNVKLADPIMSSRDLIKDASLITVIASSIGFEGLILGKPVAVFGNAPFSFLDDKMIREVRDLSQSSQIIKKLISDYEYDEEDIMAYIAAAISESTPVDYYTKLSKRLAFRLDDGEESRDQQFERLALYLLSQKK